MIEGLPPQTLRYLSPGTKALGADDVAGRKSCAVVGVLLPVSKTGDRPTSFYIATLLRSSPVGYGPETFLCFAGGVGGVSQRHRGPLCLCERGQLHVARGV